jgi:hypothetical protein
MKCEVDYIDEMVLYDPQLVRTSNNKSFWLRKLIVRGNNKSNLFVFKSMKKKFLEFEKEEVKENELIP